LLEHPANLILARLSKETRESFADSLKPASLDSGRVVEEVGMPIKHVYFPQTAVLTTVQLMREGVAAAVSVVGREGISGLDAVLRDGPARGHVVCQVPGAALSISVRELRVLIRQHASLLNSILHYTSGYCAMLSQLIACNRLHQVERRCARWLLMILDRTKGPIFPVTQERLSVMLGAQRPTVTTTLAALRATGCLETSRGQVRITNRKRLESYACECYGLCAGYFDFSAADSLRRKLGRPAAAIV
jgi:CRP-like cAMP-binding protein